MFLGVWHSEHQFERPKSEFEVICWICCCAPLALEVTAPSGGPLSGVPADGPWRRLPPGARDRLSDSSRSQTQHMQVLGRNEEEHRRRGSPAEGSSPNFAVFPGALARARVPGTAFSLLLPLGNPPSLLLEAAIGPADPLAPSPPLPRLSSSVSTVSHAPAPTFLRQQGAAQPRNSSLLVRLLFEHLPPA